MSIKSQILFSVGTLVALIVAVGSGMIYVTSTLSAASLHTDLSGRQRALSQRTAKEALIYAAEPTKENAGKLKTTLTVFTKSIEGMLNGGSVPMSADNSNYKFIPRVADAEALGHGQRELELWKPIRAAAQRLIASKGKDRDALRYVVDHNMELFAAANDMTNRLADATAENARFMLVVEVLILALSLTAGVVALLVGRRVSSAIVDLTDHADIISRGEINKPVPTDGPGEVAVLGKSLDRMRISLKKSMEMLSRADIA
ncbi:MAG TPA: HAMP domain-containing protein [Deltaproteobacteria bacterium]|nr:HAMP domain-containing protein [Deltaproteobacteria bacterium]